MEQGQRSLHPVDPEGAPLVRRRCVARQLVSLRKHARRLGRRQQRYSTTYVFTLSGSIVQTLPSLLRCIPTDTVQNIMVESWKSWKFSKKKSWVFGLSFSHTRWNTVWLIFESIIALQCLCGKRLWKVNGSAFLTSARDRDQLRSRVQQLTHSQSMDRKDCVRNSQNPLAKCKNHPPFFTSVFKETL